MTHGPSPASSSSAAAGPPAGALVQVTTDNGTACGTLAPSDAGTLAINVFGQRLDLTLSEIRAVHPVASC